MNKFKLKKLYKNEMSKNDKMEDMKKGETPAMEKKESMSKEDSYSENTKKATKNVLSKSQAAKQARKGKDMGKKGKNFAKIAAKSGGGEKGQRIAGSIFQKMRAAGKL